MEFDIILTSPKDLGELERLLDPAKHFLVIGNLATVFPLLLGKVIAVLEDASVDGWTSEPGEVKIGE